MKMKTRVANNNFHIKITEITVAGYKAAITGESWIIRDRKLEQKITYSFNSVNHLQEGTFKAGSMIDNYFKGPNGEYFEYLPDLYRIRIEILNNIPSSGQIQITFIGLLSGL